MAWRYANDVITDIQCGARYSNRIKIIKSVDYTPLDIRLSDTKCRRGMGRFTLSNHPFCVLRTNELVNDVTLFFL